MARTSSQYAGALWSVLRNEESAEKRREAHDRFHSILKREGAEYLLPSILERLEELVERDKEAEVHVRTAKEFPELVAGVEVYKGDHLVDNTLKSRFRRLSRALHENL